MKKITFVSSLSLALSLASLGGLFSQAGCSPPSDPSAGHEASRPPAKATADPQASGDTAEVAAADDGGDDLFATVTSIEEDGELCPPPSSGGPNVTYKDHGHTFLDFEDALGSCEFPNHPSLAKCSSAPSCTVTIELDVPSGHRMGLPNIVWSGGISGNTGAVTMRRTYAFDGGETVSTPTENVPDKPFALTDRGFAILSPTCSGSGHARLVATFQAQRLDDETAVWLNHLALSPSAIGGTQFEDCASGRPTDLPSAMAGDWCGGRNHRPCASGLTCEREQPGLNTDVAGQAEGTESTNDPEELLVGECVDPKERVRPREEGEDCGGIRDIGCTDGSVCWHAPGADPSALGRCKPAVGTETNPCHVGTPWIECGEGLVCNEPTKACVPAPGMSIGDACSLTGFPRCQDPLICRGGTCDLPAGQDGDPCGDTYPTCEGGECVDGYCRVSEVASEPCGDELPACARGTECRDGYCTRASFTTTNR